MTSAYNYSKVCWITRITNIINNYDNDDYDDKTFQTEAPAHSMEFYQYSNTDNVNIFPGLLAVFIPIHPLCSYTGCILFQI